jgi:hypothetical protein
VPDAAPDAAPKAVPGASEIERNVLEALARWQPLTARKLAEQAGYRLNSYFRGILARMRRDGLLRHGDAGYTAAPRPGHQPDGGS